MTKLHKLERKLDKIFNEDFPSLPSKTKKLIVKYLPWLSLIGGLLTAWADWDLWRWGHLATISGYLTNITNLYTNGKLVQSSNQMSFGIWLAVVVLGIEAVIYISAYFGLKDQKESGWNLVFYGALINLLYGIVIAFTSYGGFGSLVLALIVSVIVFYIIFQIRSAYTKKK